MQSILIYSQRDLLVNISLTKLFAQKRYYKPLNLALPLFKLALLNSKLLYVYPQSYRIYNPYLNK